MSQAGSWHDAFPRIIGKVFASTGQCLRGDARLDDWSTGRLICVKVLMQELCYTVNVTLSDLRLADILLGTILHQTTRTVRHITAYVEFMEPYPGSPSPGPLAAACSTRLRRGMVVAQAGVLT